MSTHERFMQRCLDIAKKGFGQVAPNPMVGSVLVRDGEIISEGYHQKYGEAHAEVNALANFELGDLTECTLYVSLEPCSHHGKTPPCAELLLSKGIKKVVVACLDPNPDVAGKGIKLLKNNGVEVVLGCLEKEAISLNKRFMHFHKHKSPYTILKWAQSLDGFMAPSLEDKGKRIQWITQPDTQILNHKWRSQEQAILIGSKTFNKDKALLNNRLWPGSSPHKMVLCNKLSTLDPNHLKKWATSNDATVFYKQKDCDFIEGISYQLGNSIADIQLYCFKNGLSSLIVEGGKKVLELFINEDAWQETRILIGNCLLSDGLKAPMVKGESCINELANGDKYIQIEKQ